MQLSDFLTYVRYTFKRTDKNTELTQFYNDMINWVATFMPHGNYKFQSYINTSVGTEDYPLPTNLVHLIKPVRLILGSGASDTGYQLEDISKEEYDRREPNPNWNTTRRGRPSAACIYSRSILVTPIPDLATYYLEINWNKRKTDMSANSDTPSLGSEWDEVLKWGTLERAYASIGLVDEAEYYGSKYHIIDPASGRDVPVGLAATLFQIERDREEEIIGQVQNNSL